MWLLEMLLVSVVAGTILGIGWRAFDEWQERAKREEQENS